MKNAEMNGQRARSSIPTGTEILKGTPDIINILIIINISHNYEFQNRYDPLQSSPTGDSAHTCQRYFYCFCADRVISGRDDDSCDIVSMNFIFC
jgi:hypothetical protein